MTTAYETFGLSRTATRAELDAAYRAKIAEYAPERAAVFGEDFVQLAHQRRAELTVVYQDAQAAIAMPQRLAPAALRRRERETVVVLVVLVALALLVPLVRNIAVPTRTVVANGSDAAVLTSNMAPDFTLLTLDGNEVSLSDFKGQVVVINYWATWCPPCVREIPRLLRISEQYRDQGVVVLGVNTTWQDDRAKVEQFVREKAMRYPVLLESTSDVAEQYRVRLMPTTFIIDRSGRIVHSKVGEVDEATLEGQIKTLIAAQPTSP